MTTETLKICKKNFSDPDETRDCGHGKLELISLEDTTMGRVTLKPGWKWSQHVRPMAKTDFCDVMHVQYVISGRLKIAMADGTETELGPGDFTVIAPGHDAWVIGNEPFVAIDCSPAMKEFTKESCERHQK